MFLKFEWRRPNDDAPVAATIIEPAPIDGLGEVAAELTGPWPDYPAALDEAMAAASGSGKAEAAAWLLARSQELLAKHDHDGNGTSDVVDDLLL